MELREYLFKKNITIKDFAFSIGYSDLHISEVASKKRRPGRVLIDLIEQATEGKVTKKDLLRPGKGIKLAYFNTKKSKISS